MEALFSLLLVLAVVIAIVCCIRKQQASIKQNKRIANHLTRASKVKYPKRTIAFNSETASFKACAFAAKNGHPVAQFKLGEYYFKHNDIKNAEQWFALASAQGHALATAYLGILCMTNNTHSGNATATELFKLAHAQVDDDSSLPDEVKSLARQQIINAFESASKQAHKRGFIPYLCD